MKIIVSPQVVINTTGSLRQLGVVIAMCGENNAWYERVVLGRLVGSEPAATLESATAAFLFVPRARHTCSSTSAGVHRGCLCVWVAGEA